MRMWVAFLAFFVSLTLPFASTLKQKFSKWSVGPPQSFWRFPPFISSNENMNAIQYDPVVSSRPFEPPVSMLAELGLMNLPHIQVMCNATHLTVHVDIHLNGVELNREEIVLGEGCLSNVNFANQLAFKYHYSKCATKYSGHNGRKVYSNVLHFNPKGSSATWWLPPFSMPFSCTSKRSKVRPAPRIATHRSLSEKYWIFSLKAMHPSWLYPEESNLYYRGQVVHLQAAATVDPDQSLFIQSCYVSAFSDPAAHPRLEVIGNEGCTKLMGSGQAVVAQFMAFRRQDSVNLILNTSYLQTEVYLHCRVIISKSVTADSKCCNYDDKESRWVELNGDFDVCSCCGSKCKGSSSRDTHIAAKAVVSSGLLIIVDRPIPEPQSVCQPDHSSSHMEPIFVQSDLKDPHASVHMTSSAMHGAPAPTGVVVSADSLGSSLMDNTIPEIPWPTPSTMNDMMVLSQDLGDTVTTWVPGQLQIKADLGGMEYLVQTEAPAEFVQRSSINDEREEVQLYPQKNTVKREQKNSVISSMENVDDSVLRDAQGDNVLKGVEFVSYGWTHPLDLTKSYTEWQRKQSGGRAKVVRKTGHAYRMMGLGFKPKAMDHILNKMALLEKGHSYKIGDDGVGLVDTEKVEPEVDGKGADESSSVVRSNLQESRGRHDSHMLRYKEKIRQPGWRGMTFEVLQKGMPGKGLASFLDMLRKLDMAE